LLDIIPIKGEILEWDPTGNSGFNFPLDLDATKYNITYGIVVQAC